MNNDQIEKELKNLFIEIIILFKQSLTKILKEENNADNNES